MRRSFAVVIAAGLSFSSPVLADRPEKPTLVVTRDGADLLVTVTGVTDYCSTDADTHVLRSSEAIRIIEDRPARVSRCIATQERRFVVKGVGRGRYLVSFERMPLVAPARPIRVAWANVALE